MQLIVHVTEARSGKTRVNILDQGRTAGAVNGSSPAAKRQKSTILKQDKTKSGWVHHWLALAARRTRSWEGDGEGQKTDDTTAGFWKLGQLFINAPPLPFYLSLSLFLSLRLSIPLSIPPLFFSQCMSTEQWQIRQTAGAPCWLARLAVGSSRGNQWVLTIERQHPDS